MSIETSAERRQKNIETFRTMLHHLGRKEFDLCKQYLTPDLVSDWPYPPVPDFPEQLETSTELMRVIREGSAEFDPFDYQITQIYELVDPDKLVVEYYSRSNYRPKNRTYSNKYLGIFHFREGKVSYWREYVNPETIRQAMLDFAA
ncbi:MAG: nuclear transport factor 2 family protein [Proteobacteria bacterium]|nr:nuclear transport factor 2 family protein [Pseudomonadota bacterium]HQR03065.1 nuclear transport factor 2 family protein [Rhodocyclaceae bacterium]